MNNFKINSQKNITSLSFQLLKNSFLILSISALFLLIFPVSSEIALISTVSAWLVLIVLVVSISN